MSTSQHAKARMGFSGEGVLLRDWHRWSGVATCRANLSPKHSLRASPRGDSHPHEPECWCIRASTTRSRARPHIPAQEWRISLGAPSCWGKWPSGSRCARLPRPLCEQQLCMPLLAIHSQLPLLPLPHYFSK